MNKLRIGVLASGDGSNLQSIIDSCEDGSVPAEVVLVISNNSTAKALDRAQNHGIDALHISAVTEGSAESVDIRIAHEMKSRSVDLIALAGYMKKIGPAVLDHYTGRIINIHPALLPKFGGPGMYGMHVHEAVVESGDRESGASVHFVDGKYDHGTVIDQITVPVEPNDTPETLQKRVLIQEHKIYPKVIRKLAEKWSLNGKNMGESN